MNFTFINKYKIYTYSRIIGHYFLDYVTKLEMQVNGKIQLFNTIHETKH